MKKAKEKIYAPWQHRFIAGIFGQLGLFSDRDVALYLQRESSYPKDGMSEAIFRSFAKGIGKFPKAWKEVLLKNCNQAFIDRWQEDIFNSPSIQDNHIEKTAPKSSIEAKKKLDKPKPILEQTPKPLIKKVPGATIPPTEKINPPTSELNELVENTSQKLILDMPVVPQTNQFIEAPNDQAEIEKSVSLVEKASEEIIPSMEESNEASNITPKEPLDSEISIVSQEKQEPEIIANDKNLEAKEIKPLSDSTANEPETREVNPLPESIIKILTVSLSESLEKDGKLNPRKLVRALNTRSSNYNVKRKEREIFFQGKRVTHKFTIPSDIEITAQ